MNLFSIYFIVINIGTFLVMLEDKKSAINQRFRIPEKALFLLTILGGSLGNVAAMRFIRHKSNKNSFKITIAFIVMLQIGFFIYLFKIKNPSS